MNKIEVALLSGGVGLCINGYLGIRVIKKMKARIDWLEDDLDDSDRMNKKLVEYVDDYEGLKRVLADTEFEHVIKYSVGVREDNTPYSETPTKGFNVNPRVVKLGIKLALGFATSAVVGYTIKAEKDLQARVEDHYASKPEETTTPEED